MQRPAGRGVRRVMTVLKLVSTTAKLRPIILRATVGIALAIALAAACTSDDSQQQQQSQIQQQGTAAEPPQQQADAADQQQAQLDDDQQPEQSAAQAEGEQADVEPAGAESEDQADDQDEPYAADKMSSEDQQQATENIPPIRRWLVDGAPLNPSAPAEGDEYGWGAAIEGDVLAVSAPYHDAAGQDTGAVFVFERIDGEWLETAYLTPEYPDSHGWFGRWIALEQGRLVIGAPYEDVIGLDGVRIDDSGIAYVYEKVGGEWRRTGTLLPAAPKAGASFGWSVSIWGDRIAVSAWQDTVGDMMVGSVTTYIQRKGLWQPEAIFQPQDPTHLHMFGRDIELYENILVVGAPGDDTIAEDAGAIFVWHYYANQWNFAGKLLASDGAAADRLGSQVALQDGWLASGGYDHDTPAWSNGAVYVWKLENIWYFHSKLQPSDLQPGDWFGYSVDINDGILVAGSPHRAHPETGTYRSGAAYAFELVDDRWVEIGVFGPVDAIESGASAEFGWVTEVDGMTSVVGAWLADAEAGPDAGAAAVYEIPEDFDESTDQESAEDEDEDEDEDDGS